MVNLGPDNMLGGRNCACRFELYWRCNIDVYTMSHTLLVVQGPRNKNCCWAPRDNQSSIISMVNVSGAPSHVLGGPNREGRSHTEAESACRSAGLRIPTAASLGDMRGLLVAEYTAAYHVAYCACEDHVGE
jgi:hypothetical protein